MRSKRLHSYSSTLSPSLVYKNGNAGESCSWSTGINQVVHCNVHIKKLPIARLSVVLCSWSKASGGFYGVCWAESACECDTCSRLLSCVYHPSTGDNIMWYCSLVDCTRGKGGVKYRRKKRVIPEKTVETRPFLEKNGV
jgi:hypothetical protein